MPFLTVKSFLASYDAEGALVLLKKLFLTKKILCPGIGTLVRSLSPAVGNPRFVKPACAVRNEDSRYEIGRFGSKMYNILICFSSP